MAHLVLGPALRYVGDDCASVWFETDASCAVTVTAGDVAATAETFHVHGHHFALVILRGLEPGSCVPYTVEIDGAHVWPHPDDGLPAPVIRPLAPGAPARLLFGSCRVALPHEPPFTLTPDQDDWGFNRDALHAYALRMLDHPTDAWPQLMFFCGDQVYADELSPVMQSVVDKRRRSGVEGPPDEAADFEEFSLLYRDSWRSRLIRWFMSVVPTAMIFDDHDVQDDWNTSWSWMEDRRKLPWWERKMGAALGSYWIYQHAGNLHPDELEGEELWQAIGAAGREEDLAPTFDAFGVKADLHRDACRWSYARDIGPARFVAIDSRGARQLDPDDRRMVDREEWAWIEEQAQGGHEHLLLGTSIPWLMAPAMHDLQRWDEAVSQGAWGGLAGRAGEWIRQAYDLEHWPAWGTSWLEFAELARAVGAGEKGAAPATIIALSGDVHHAYLTEATWPEEAGVSASVWQATCSPVRNPLSKKEAAGMRLLRTKGMQRLAKRLAESAGAYEAPMTWEECAGPSFDNQIATIDMDGREARITIERAVGHPAEPPRLEAWLERRLDRDEPDRAPRGVPAPARPVSRAAPG